MQIRRITKLAFLISGFLFAFMQTASAQCTGNVSVFPYQEGFELGNGNWTPGGTASDWALGTPTKPVINGAAAGTQCWITGGLSGSSYNNGENSWLQSPCFDFTSLVNPQISFSIFWETEKKYDGANMEYSTDAGANWNLLGSVNDNSCIASNWFNNASVNFLGAANGWSGNVQPTSGSCLGGSGSAMWLAARHDLTALAGLPSVTFRFRFGAGTTCNGFDGFAVDDVIIDEASPNSADFTYTCNSNRDVSFTSSAALCASTYTWDFGDIASGANNASALPNPSHIFSAAGTYTVNLQVTYPTGPPGFAMHTFDILDVNINKLSPILCNGNKTGSIQAVASGGAGPYSYTWNTTPVQTSATLNNIGAGSYTVTVSSPSSCNTTATYTLTEPTAISAAPTTTAATCGNSNGSITVIVSGGVAPYQYNWSNGGTTATISNIPPGNYSLSGKDANNCVFSKNNITVADNNSPVTISLGNDTSICKGETLLLYPGVFTSYRWQDNSTGPTFSVSTSGKYWVRGTDGTGCSGTDTINVLVDCSGLYFPGAFIPKGNALNRMFGPLGNLGSVQNYSLTIYDRYGQMIFHSTNPYQQWDGRLKGGMYNSGAFAWFVNYNIIGQAPVEQKGMVVLIR